MQKKQKDDTPVKKASVSNTVNGAKVIFMMIVLIAVIAAIGVGRVTYIKLVHGNEYESELKSMHGGA